MKRKKKTIIAICSIAFALTLAVGTMLFDSKGQNIARAEIIFPENEGIKKEYSILSIQSSFALTCLHLWFAQ